MLIQELGEILGVSLSAEQGFLCKLNIKDKVKVQIEYEESSDRIILACFIAEIPPGKFREGVLSAGLKANYLDPSLGIFCYAEGPENLILQMYLPGSTQPALFATLLQQFTDKGIKWKEGLEQGSLNSLVPSSSSSLPSPMNLS